ncbi:MAG: carboxypeptidase regulatory-like domain-containing protein [Planctomycetes bacterium]|nr:carboxypeptidase regulatory-like domain-containing protein [Planctomycetota bacterium]
MSAKSSLSREQRGSSDVARGVKSLAVLASLVALVCGCTEASSPPAVAPQAPTASAEGVFQPEGLSELGYAQLSPAESALVSGRVVDPAGQPLARFTVRALLFEHINFPQSVGTRELQDVHDGAFELAGLQPGRMVIEASAPGFAASFSAPLATTAGSSTKNVEVRLSLGGTLTGRVIDAHTADAIPGAEVRVFDAYELWLDPAQLNRPHALTDAKGGFTLEHVPAGDGSLLVRCAGYAQLELSDVHADEGQTRELPLLALAQGATVAGVVHGLDGAPLAGANVQLSAAAESGGNRTARTDAAGRFRIEHVVPGTYQLSATRPEASKVDPFELIGDMRRSQREIVVAEQQSYEFELHLDEKPR